MTDKRRFLDVWITSSNTVYREVPFNVVADWVQQGRLLEEDKLRPSGTADWFPIARSPEFTPYLPRPEPYRVEDQAEALEPVELDFRWKKPRPDEDDDVDMIPLIDVSLVLLIFFMLTATGVGAVFVPTPPADYGMLSSNSEEVALSINLEGEGDNRVPVFSLSVGSRGPAAEDTDLRTKEQLLARLQAYLEKTPDTVEVTINAHPDVKAGLVRDLTADLEREPFRRRVREKFIGVSERQP
jgi:biopolymer transport protein ExbD